MLSLVKISSYWSGGFDWGGEWCLRFGPHQDIRVYAVVSGECWLALDDVPEPVHGRPGDCLLLPSGRPFRVGSNLALPPTDALTLASSVDHGGVTIHNGGGNFFGIGCNFRLAGEHANLLLGVLPPVVHIYQESDKSVLRWCIERMREELRTPQPGSFLVAQQLATLLLVQALRLHLIEGSQGVGVGWLFALANPQMRVALSAMHDDPGRRWTLGSLAKRAGMSRTAFAVKFKQSVGQSPLDYLLRWRMRRAATRLTHFDGSVAALAQSLGYGSESAFSTAFKRVMSCSPRQYSRNRLAAPASGIPVENSRTGMLESALSVQKHVK